MMQGPRAHSPGVDSGPPSRENSAGGQPRLRSFRLARSRPPATTSATIRFSSGLQGAANPVSARSAPESSTPQPSWARGTRAPLPEHKRQLGDRVASWLGDRAMPPRGARGSEDVEEYAQRSSGRALEEARLREFERQQSIRSLRDASEERSRETSRHSLTSEELSSSFERSSSQVGAPKPGSMVSSEAVESLSDRFNGVEQGVDGIKGEIDMTFSVLRVIKSTLAQMDTKMEVVLGLDAKLDMLVNVARLDRDHREADAGLNAILRAGSFRPGSHDDGQYRRPLGHSEEDGTPRRQPPMSRGDHADPMGDHDVVDDVADAAKEQKASNEAEKVLENMASEATGESNNDDSDLNHSRNKFREIYSAHDHDHGAWRHNTDDKMAVMRPKVLTGDMFERIGHSIYFKLFSVAAIFISVGLMAVQTELQVTEYMGVNLCIEGKGPAPASQTSAAFFENVEWGMLGWMLIELGINMYISGGFFAEDAGWNIFDAIIILASMLQKIFAGINLSGLRVLRVGRALKFVRIFKVAKAFKVAGVTRILNAVRKMLICLMGSLTSLFWAIVLIFIFLFITAVMLMQGIEVYYDYYLDTMPTGVCQPGGPGNGLWDGKPTYNEIFPKFMVDPETDTHTEQVKKLYGTVGRTIMTLFSTISGGAEWQIVADPVMRMSGAFVVFWVVFICVALFGVLNVFTGIFCETAMAAAASDTQTIMRQELEEVASCQATLRDAFGKIDVDNSGSLTESELELVLTDPFVIATLMKIGLQASESKGLFRLLDEDRSGTLSCEEFVDGCISLKGGARRVDVVTLMTQNRRLTKTVNSLMEMCDSMWTNLEQGLKQSRSV